MDTFIGTIMPVGFNFAPKGWAQCDGQLLPIAQNQALFSLLGTTYGGDGRTTFALPDLRGRVSVGDGNSPALSPYKLGQKGGVETVSLTQIQLPSHSHGVNCTNTGGNVSSPVDALAGADTVPTVDVWNNSTANAQMDSRMIATSGAGTSHENRQPYETVNWVIALYGVYPSRG